MALERWHMSEVLSFDASADLSGKQSYLLKLHTTEDQVALAGAGEKVIGIQVNKPTSGLAAQVLTEGVGMVVAGGTVAINDYIKADSAGKGVVTTSANDEVCGRALGAAASGELFAMKIMRFRY